MDFRPTPPARLLPMTFKKIWFQLHWFVGITAGTVLIVIGLSGAVFSFHEEILGWLNPGTASVPARDAAPLGFEVVVASDAVATRAITRSNGESVDADSLHRAALAEIEDVFGDVMPTAHVMQLALR